MAGTVKIPGIGPVKSTWVWAGGAVMVAILGYAYYKHKQNAAASSSTAAGTAQATIDPATGYPSGSPEDQAALASQAGGGAGYTYGGGYSGEGSGYTDQQYYYDPADGLYDLTSPYTGTTTTTGTTGTSGATANTGPGTFTDNAYWVQYAIEQVQGYSAADIQGALSAYLSGLGLTTTQMSIYQAALAVADAPPQPPSQPAHLATQSAAGTSGSGTGSSGGGVITVAPSGLHVTHVYTNSAQVAWSALHPPAGQGPVSGYGVECYDSAGNTVNGPFTVSPGQLYANIGSLKTKTAYHVSVWADPAKSGGPHATATFTTT